MMPNATHLSVIENQFCPLCDKPFQLFLSAVSDSQSHDFFSIAHCDSCHLQKTLPQPDDIKSYYSPHYHDNRHSFTAHFCVKRRIKWVNQFKKNSAKLLDIGCGDGAFLMAAQQFGWEIYGTEMNLKEAKEKKISVYDDIKQTEIHAPFHCITLWHSLEHMPEPVTLLQRLQSLLSADGTLWIAVPNASGWQARLFGKYWMHRDVPRHLYHFNLKSLQKLLNQTGFEIIQSFHQEFEYDVLGWSQSALNYIFATPNQFFNLLTGRKKNINGFEKIKQIVFGVLFSALSLVLLPLSVVAKSGGTLIVAARKKADF